MDEIMVLFLLLGALTAISAIRLVIEFKVYSMKKIEFDQKYKVVHTRSDKEADELNRWLCQNGWGTVSGEPLDYPNEH